MRRREFIMLLGGTAALPLVASAQEPRRRFRIGVLLPGPPVTYANPIAHLRRALYERGYIEPQTLEFVFRYAGTELNRLAEFARELVAAQVDVIVTSATPAVRAAMAATSTIPIVIAAAADVVGSGLVANLARPSGNVTGLTLLIPELGAKQLEIVKEFVPALARVGVLRGRMEGAQAFETLRAAVTALGLESHFEEIDSHHEIVPAFARMASAKCQGAILIDGPTFNPHRDLVATAVASSRMPTVSTLRLFVEAGSLASYGPDLGAMWRRAAYYVDRILKGTPPGELPVEQPTSFELVINARTAKLLGLATPESLLARANDVIE